MKKTPVVLADHEHLFRAALKQLLADVPGLEVVGEAANGPAAAEMVRKKGAALLLTEMDLPYWNGVILTRQVRKASPDTAVLLLSRNDTEHLVCDAIREGARGYVLKTATPAALTAAIERALGDGEPYLHEDLPPTVVRASADGGPPPATSRYDLLSPREREVLKLLVLGNRNQEVAELLGISVKTVEIHRARIMEKLDLHRLAHLVRYAIERGIVDTPKGTPSIHMPFTPRRGRPAGSKNRKRKAAEAKARPARKSA